MPRSSTADSTDWLTVHDPLAVVAWRDPVVEQFGHTPRSVYMETYWLPVLGPSAFGDVHAGHALDVGDATSAEVDGQLTDALQDAEVAGGDERVALLGAEEQVADAAADGVVEQGLHDGGRVGRIDLDPQGVISGLELGLVCHGDRGLG